MDSDLFDNDSHSGTDLLNLGESIHDGCTVGLTHAVDKLDSQLNGESSQAHDQSFSVDNNKALSTACRLYLPLSWGQCTILAWVWN